MKYKILCFICLATLTLGSLAHVATAQQNSAQNTNDAAATQILEKNVAAIGGRAAFDAIKAVEVQTERQVLGRTITTTRIVDVQGKRAYQRQDGGSGVIESGFDGQKAWQKAPFFKGYLDAANPQTKSLMRGGLRLPGASLYDYKTSKEKFSRLEDEQIANKNYLVVKSSYADEAGKETLVKYYFDPATFLLKQTVSGNGAVTQTETFDDYRKVSGVTVAFASVITNPQVTLSSKITQLKFNQPFDAAIFQFQESSPAQPAKAMTSAPNAASEASQSETSKVESSSLTETSGGEKLSEKMRLETFEMVWKTVNDTFYDRTFNGVDWQAVHEKYLPMAKAAAKPDDFHDLLNRMVQELHLSHFKVIAPKNVLTLSSDPAKMNNGSIGLGLKWIENQLIVSEVKKDSPAALAGVRPGFILRRVDEKTPAELYAEYQKNNPGFQLREELARVRAVLDKLTGKPGTKISLEFADELDNSLKLELARKARPVARQLEFESKKIDENVGYIKFNFFFGDLLPKFQTALGDLRDSRSLIIDLRGNPGGAGDLAPALANLLCAAPGSLGSLKYRYETTEYLYKGTGEQAYKGKIILLIDEGTGSTAEVFAGGLQANKRAAVVGSRSAGAVLPSLVTLLPTGGALQYVVSNFQTPNGVALESKGVMPDIFVQTTRQALLINRDEVLERAIKFAGE